VVGKAPQTSSIALLKKEEAAVLQELYSSASSSTPSSSGIIHSSFNFKHKLSSFFVFFADEK
jgi:hypothetical protein